MFNFFQYHGSGKLFDTSVLKIALLILFISVTACSQQQEPSIDEATYEDILIELELIVNLHIQTMDSTLTDSLIDLVWEKYEVTEAMFKESHQIYVSDVTGQLERIQRISTRLSEEHLETEMKLYEMREQERLETQALIEAMKQNQ